VCAAYAIGAAPEVAAEVARALGTPILLVFEGEAAANKELPLRAYVRDAPVPLALATAPTERIVLDGAAGAATTDAARGTREGEVAAALASLQAERRAAHMLRTRLAAAAAYVEGVQHGTYPHDFAILRMLAEAVANAAPRTPEDEAALQAPNDATFSASTDALLSRYLATLTGNLSSLNEVRSRDAAHTQLTEMAAFCCPRTTTTAAAATASRHGPW